MKWILNLANREITTADAIKQGHVKVILGAEVFARHPRGFRMAGTLLKSIVQKNHVVISSLSLTENVELLC